MAPKIEAKQPEPTPSEVVGGDEDEVKKEEWNKELTEEQLQQFNEQFGVTNDDVVKFMAIELLGFKPNYAYEGLIAIILDYFVGVLMFAKEEKLGVLQTILVYKISHSLVDLIKAGADLRESEKAFKTQLLQSTVKVHGTNHVPQLTTVDLQKIVPFFMTTVFQHYSMYKHCFFRESLHWHYNEEVWVETALVIPLVEASTKEEIEDDKAAKEAYEKALAEWEAARLAVEAKALWDLEHPPVPRRPPDGLDEAIEFGVRDRVEEVLRLMQAEYDQRGTYLVERVRHLEDQTNKKK